ELIRALAGVGHEVFATDTFSPTLGSHSRHLRRHFVTPPPRHDPEGFGRALLEVITNERIDWLIPTCAEAFHVGRPHETLSAGTDVLCLPLADLDHWHNKFSFQQHAASRGLWTPRTDLVDSPEKLKAALARYPHYLLKPTYSRFAARIITNCGPRAGRCSLSA